MKNIHLLPTDKPSRLIIYSTLLNEFRLLNDPIEDWKHKKHIYITNSEEIKDEEWGYNIEYEYIVKYDSKKHDDKFWYKKIILTTDGDLIADGVQAIDDEFLEWFVKNPSCEEVEVADLWKEGTPSAHDSYHISIPQEEPKQDYKPNSCDIIFETAALIENKQETLEEAAEKYCLINNIPTDQMIVKNNRSCEFETPVTMFIKGAKWQQERRYSEEDLRNAYRWGTTVNHGTKEHFNEWFEQFKKK
jgi:hypothetical protein